MTTVPVGSTVTVQKARRTNVAVVTVIKVYCWAPLGVNDRLSAEQTQYRLDIKMLLKAIALHTPEEHTQPPAHTLAERKRGRER